MVRDVPTSMTQGFQSPAKIGARRPMIRATVQKQRLYSFDYDQAWAQGGGEIANRDQHRTGHFRTFLFGEKAKVREIPNIKSCSWERGIGEDAATCTLTILNTVETPLGAVTDDNSSLDKMGALTASRGDPRWSGTNPWGYTGEGWTSVLVPDAVIKTYEGYGHDPTKTPAQDPFLMQSGTWKVDTVTYNPDGTITLEMRDMAFLFLDQVVFPPAVPLAEYPLAWIANHTEQVPARDCVGGYWKDRLRTIGTASSSNDLYVGEGFTNEPFDHYVQSNGNVQGHSDMHPIGRHDRFRYAGGYLVNKELTSNVVTLETKNNHNLSVGDQVTIINAGATFEGDHTVTATPTSKTFRYAKTHADVASTPISGNDALVKTPDAAAAAHDDSTYWRATGQDSLDSFVWWEFEVNDGRVPVGAIRARPIGGPFRVYVSIHNGSRWVGKKDIPYELNGIAGSPGNFDIGADIPFVKSFIADRYFSQDWVLPRKYMAKRIRLTFTHLRQREVGEHPFRCGLREFQIYTANDIADLSFEKGTVMKLVGNYGDYTHIVKWVSAWAGFYWPGEETGMDCMRVGPNEDPIEYIHFNEPDPVLPKGRVWGDFMKTGTKGIADLTVDMFDKKPLMDIINYIRDLTGYIFFVDETGGVVWRQPNVWELGNYESPGQEADGRPGHRRRTARTAEIVTLNEDVELQSWTAKLDSANVRERVFVANAVGGYGTVVRGFNPYRVGLKRVAGYSDQRFESKAEVRVMADLIVTNQMFTYRTGQAVISGYPKIQVDDQVRIYERVTNETFYHYVMSIKSEIDMETGVWTYELGTHWLGTNPENGWVVDAQQLDAATQQYLFAIGYRPTNAEDGDIDEEWEEA